MNSPRGRFAIGALVALTLLLSLLVIPTTGAFTAKISNTTNVAGLKYLTCASAIQKTSGLQYGWVFKQVPVPDLSGSTNTLTRVGAENNPYTLLTTNPCANDQQNSVHFTGYTGGIAGYGASYLRVQTTSPQLASYSLEAWFRTSSAEGNIVGMYNTYSYRDEIMANQRLYLNSSGQAVFASYNTGGTYDYVTTPGSVADGAWHHIVATFDGSRTMRLYLDGVLVATKTGAGVAETWSTQWGSWYWRPACGQFFSSGTYFKSGIPFYEAGGAKESECFLGDIAFLSVYNRALTEGEVLGHYMARLPN